VRVGDKVSMDNMWKHATAVGVIEKLTIDYIVVKWEGIPGHWHYTYEQATKLKRMETEDESG